MVADVISSVKVRSYRWRVGSYFNMIGVLIKEGNLDTDMHIGRKLCEHADEPLQAKERGMEQILPSQRDQPSQHTLISDFQPPEM